MKHTKWIAIILLTTTLGSSIGLFFKTIGETENIKNTAYIFENNDRNIAETLSSMSGKSIDSILDTKAKFGDWNTVTKQLQAGEIRVRGKRCVSNI